VIDGTESYVHWAASPGSAVRSAADALLQSIELAGERTGGYTGPSTLRVRDARQ